MLEVNWKLVLYAIGFLATYLIVGGIWRVYFHPLSHLPGPKLAGLTYFYQSYFDIYPYQGRWLWQQIALHDKYGPIVRVGPDEVHISDPTFYDQAFGSATHKRDKSMLWYWFSGSGANIDGAAFTTLDHRLHALRRAAMNPFFSMKKVRELEGRVRVHIERMKDVLGAAGRTGEVVNLFSLTSALTMDVVSEYSFGKSTEMLKTSDLGKQWREMFEIGIKVHPIGRQFRPLVVAMMRVTETAANYFSALESIKYFDHLIEGLTKPAYDKALARGQSGKPNDPDETTSIIEALALDPRLPPEERSWQRLCAEASNLIGAGTETTARTLAVGLYHILADSSIHKNLLAELRTVMPSPESPLPSVTALSKLPYLTACIHESTRLGHGVAGRLVRIAPDEDLHCHGYTIPRGATFSMSSYIQHMNAHYFPEPAKFVPERYLGDKEKVSETMRYLVPFSRGPRMCLGMQLAWSEIYLGYASLIGSVNMVLAGTTEYDVEPAKEYFLALSRADSKGILVRVEGEEKGRRYEETVRV